MLRTVTIFFYDYITVLRQLYAVLINRVKSCAQSEEKSGTSSLEWRTPEGHVFHKHFTIYKLI